MESKNLKMALVGNPNSGKTTFFNYLTGSNQYVGNRPGVTVEKKEGKVKKSIQPDYDITLVDLPGIYSLSPYSLEEIVAADYLVKEKPEVVVNIVDATNIERNLYLSVQLLEMERPVVVALNMMDEVHARGDKINIGLLSKFFNIPIVPITAKTGEGVRDVIKEAIRQAKKNNVMEPEKVYDEFTRSVHRRMDIILNPYAKKQCLPTHWVSIKILEGDMHIQKKLQLSKADSDKIERLAEEYEGSNEKGDRESMVIDSRYRYIEKAVRASVTKAKNNKKTITQRIDDIVTNKYLAIPIFILIMFAVFTITFSTIGAFLQRSVSYIVGDLLAGFVSNLLISFNTPNWVESLVVDGVIGGVGGVLTFLPQIAILFCLLSLLEDSGYMARIAFIMDKMLSRFGLSGKAFIPLLMGFGCSVPAVMAARTTESLKNRRMTVLLVPFISCSAKLPIYGFISQIFFPCYRGFLVLILYVLGIICGILSAILFKNILFKKQNTSFLLELPPYRLPGIKSTVRHVWDKIEHFIKKAATLIFGMSVLLWILQSFDFTLHFTQEGRESLLGIIGGIIAPIFKPAGFGTWQAAVSLLSGLVAKEAVVSSICLFYGIPSTAGAEAAVILSETFATPTSAYAFLVFVLLYVPCIAAFSAMKRELGGWKWALGSAVYQTMIAYMLAVLVNQTGKYFPYTLAALIIVFAMCCVISSFKAKCKDCHACGLCTHNICNGSKKCNENIQKQI
ncbi:MAG: ferrous iron transport protein B [Clostridia bacterium]|nr:ferrous iron transport protein B [Clostridia bacterium]